MSMMTAKLMDTWQEISDATGFDAGDEFTSEQQIRDYFQREQIRGCLNPVDGGHQLPSQTELDAMADIVIANRMHCAF